eukprot:scaffold268916_cov26-Tisochrysis_lutea.AAC.1
MGKGQRHSKNAGVMGSEALTYAERRGLGFGTVRERLGKVRQAGYACAAVWQVLFPTSSSCALAFPMRAQIPEMVAMQAHLTSLPPTYLLHGGDRALPNTCMERPHAFMPHVGALQLCSFTLKALTVTVHPGSIPYSLKVLCSTISPSCPRDPGILKALLSL